MAAPTPSGRSVWALPSCSPSVLASPHLAVQWWGGGQQEVHISPLHPHAPLLLAGAGGMHAPILLPMRSCKGGISPAQPLDKASPASLVTWRAKRMVTSGFPALSVCLSVESLSFQVKAPSSKPYTVSPSEPPAGSHCCPGGAGLRLSKRRGEEHLSLDWGQASS